MPASSSAGIIRFFEEDTPGVVATGSPQIYRTTGGTLSQTTESSEDNELRADRGRGDSTLVSGSVAGPLEINWSHNTHDDFLSALLAEDFVDVDTDNTMVIADAVFTQSAHTLAGTTTLPLIEPGQWFQLTGCNLAANDGIYKATSATHTTSLITVDTEVKDFTDDTSNSATISSGRLSQAYDDLRTFTIERELSDLAVPLFFSWKGCYVNSLSLNYSITDKLTGSFGFLGSETEVQGTSSILDDAGEAATTTPFFNSVTGTSVLLDGVTMGESCVESLTLDIQANLRERRCIGGGLSASSIGLDPFKISFSANIYFGTAASAALYAKKISDTSLTFAVCLTDSEGNGFAITVPRAKITSAEVDGGGMGSDVMLSLACDAVTDSTDATMIHIDRLGTTA